MASKVVLPLVPREDLTPTQRFWGITLLFSFFGLFFFYEGVKPSVFTWWIAFWSALIILAAMGAALLIINSRDREGELYEDQ